MQVFRTYFKIIKKSLAQISIYLGVFLCLSLVLSKVAPQTEAVDLSKSTTKVGFVCLDESTPIIAGLKDYLNTNCALTEYDYDKELLEDDLFFRSVEYIVVIPQGFTQDFLSGKEAAVEKTIVPGSTTSFYVDMLIDKYLNTAKLYLENAPAMPEDQLVAAVTNDLSHQAPILVAETEGQADQKENFSAYYRYFPYAMTATLVLSMSTIMMAFNQSDLRKRNLCSPIKYRSINLQLASGSLLFAFVCWLVLVLFGFLLYMAHLPSLKQILFYCLNSFVCTLVAISLGFLVGIFIKNYSVQSAIANVLSLGMGFLSGVFVPQELMSKEVLTFASFLPTYWYVKGNELLSETSNITGSNLSSLLTCILIQTGFAVAIFSVALLAGKHRRQSCN